MGGKGLNWYEYVVSERDLKYNLGKIIVRGFWLFIVLKEWSYFREIFCFFFGLLEVMFILVLFVMVRIGIFLGIFLKGMRKGEVLVLVREVWFLGKDFI